MKSVVVVVLNLLVVTSFLAFLHQTFPALAFTHQ